jgi:hypothetical protein
MDSDTNTASTNGNSVVRNGGLQTVQGSSGTYVMGGIITLEEYNPKLVNRKGIEAYDVMRLSDPTVHAALTACKLPLQAAMWYIKPASDEQPDQEKADFVKRELMERNVNWHQTLAEILTVFDFGFSLFEKTYGKTTFNAKTLIGLESLESRRARSIMKWETYDGKPGVYQILQKGGASIDELKLLLFTNEREGDNYQGRSVLRYAYKPWHMKHNLETITAVGIERMAVGVPVLRPPKRPEAEDITAAREFLRQFRANSQQYMELPSGWNVEMMDMKANTTKDALPFINYCSVNIMKSVLAQFLELGGSTTGSGSRSLSEDHSQFFEKAEEGKANILAEIINQNFIQQLCDLNWTEDTMPAGYPKIVFSNIGDEELSTLGAFLTAASGGGLLTPDPDMEQHLRSIARLPDLPQDIADDYGNRETIQTAITNAQLGMMTDPDLQGPDGVKPKGNQSKSSNEQNDGFDKKGQPISRNTDGLLKKPTQATHIGELQAYRRELIAAVMADERA